MRRAFHRVNLLLLLASVVHAQPTSLSVNPASREEVRQFFRTVYHASENVPMDWTGNYATGTAGDTSRAFKDATRLRINFYRALAGVPADITFSPAYNVKAQQAALLMSVNDALSHTPPPNWTLYTDKGAEGALNSNLALGQAGPEAIDGYMADPGDDNTLVGHRRWLFYPQTLQMGTGDVPGILRHDVLRAANAVWVIDTTPGGHYGAPRPTTRTAQVAYPPAGFVPYQIVWPRWSFTYPGADFTAATVTMIRGGQRISTTTERAASSPGEPTLVWTYDNGEPNFITSHARPATDTTYTVNLGNVRIGGAARSFSYNVTVFDPEVAGADFAPVSVIGTALPAVAAANSYTINKPAFADSFDWRTVQLTPLTKRFTAESGLEGLLAMTAAGYDVVQATTVGNGGRAYRLAHVDPRSDQMLLIPGTYLVNGSDSTVAFRSRLGIATATETARVQISSDDGTSWSDVFSQVGTSPTNTAFPPATEDAFIVRTLSLAPHVGRSLNIRLVYSIGLGNAFLPEPTNTVGWFIDDLTLTGVEAISAGGARRVASGSTFPFTPPTAGAVGLQARGVMFGTYPMEWGPVTPLNAVNGSVPTGTAYLSNLSVRTSAGTDAQTLIVGFAISGGTKPLLVRGIGPALTSFGVSRALNDPKLELYRKDARISENDDWLAADSRTFDGVGAFGLNRGSRDAALVVSLPSNSYTAQVSSATGGTGIALVELYDAAGAEAGAKLVNVSARSQVGTGSDILIAGFAISGTGSRTLLIRAIGPTLGVFGVAGTLADPKLELFGNGVKIEENDNWNIAARNTFSQTGAFDLETGSRDAALLVTLPPGSYTAQVSGVGGSTGVALVEVYEVP